MPRNIPQADDLSLVHSTIVNVTANKAHTDKEIAEIALGGYSDRQGRYYRHAAELLGFIKNHDNYAKPTQKGINFYALQYQDQCNELSRSVFELDVTTYLLRNLKKGEYTSPENITEVLVRFNKDEMEKDTHRRRTRTMISWLVAVGAGRAQGSGICLN